MIEANFFKKTSLIILNIYNLHLFNNNGHTVSLSAYHHSFFPKITNLSLSIIIRAKSEDCIKKNTHVAEGKESSASCVYVCVWGAGGGKILLEARVG